MLEVYGLTDHVGYCYQYIFINRTGLILYFPKNLICERYENTTSI